MHMRRGATVGPRRFDFGELGPINDVTDMAFADPPYGLDCRGCTENRLARCAQSATI